MESTPKSLRLQVGIFGRVNVGKSSFLNMIAGQDVSITSPVPGTTTDVVEKVMEFHKLGPVVFLDTAGVNDESALGVKRLEKTEKVIRRSDVILLILEPELWTGYEERIVAAAGRCGTPVVLVVNKTDVGYPSLNFIENIKNRGQGLLLCSSVKPVNRIRIVAELEEIMGHVRPQDARQTPALIGDLLPPNGLAVFITPIDQEAPKGRIKMLQVQAIRDLLDHHMAALTVKESEYAAVLNRLSRPPDLVVCDSPMAAFTAGHTPAETACTTFSILLSRYKGDLIEQIRGLRAIPGLKDGDRVLIAEACSHHPIEEDIGRVKIPQALKKFTGKTLNFDIVSGRDYPEHCTGCSLIVHCGACMITRREMLERIRTAAEDRVPVTNYGLCIAYLQGVLERMLTPFPDALRIYQQEVKQGTKRHEYALP